MEGANDVAPAGATVRRGLRNFCATAQKYLWATRGDRSDIPPAGGMASRGRENSFATAKELLVTTAGGGRRSRSQKIDKSFA